MTEVDLGYRPQQEGPSQGVGQGWGVITVLVVHDAGLVRGALEQALDGGAGLRVRVAGSVVQAVRMVREAVPDVVVTDARGAVDAGLSQALAGTGARWVVQVDADDPEQLADVLLSGARGLYSDHTMGTGLVDAVAHVAAGQGWLAPELVPALLRDYLPYYRRRSAARRQLEALGSNEIRLLGLVADGRTNAEVAAELHLAVSTVKDYVGALLGRLGVTRSEAIALAVRADLASVPGGLGRRA